MYVLQTPPNLGSQDAMRAGRGNFPVKVGHSTRMACSCSVVSARVEQERLYVCMYVCMYVCVCLYVYMDMYVNMYIFMYVCIYIYICMYTCICVYLYIYVLYIYLYNLCDRLWCISQAKSCQELNTTVTVITGWYTPNLLLIWVP